MLEEPKVVPFLEGSYTLEQALADLDKKARSRLRHSHLVRPRRGGGHSAKSSQISAPLPSLLAATRACLQSANMFKVVTGCPRAVWQNESVCSRHGGEDKCSKRVTVAMMQFMRQMNDRDVG